jgi:hypothetical protein
MLQIVVLTESKRTGEIILYQFDILDSTDQIQMRSLEPQNLSAILVSIQILKTCTI